MKLVTIGQPPKPDAQGNFDLPEFLRWLDRLTLLLDALKENDKEFDKRLTDGSL